MHGEGECSPAAPSPLQCPWPLLAWASAVLSRKEATCQLLLPWLLPGGCMVAFHWRRIQAMIITVTCAHSKHISCGKGQACYNQPGGEAMGSGDVGTTALARLRQINGQTERDEAVTGH